MSKGICTQILPFSMIKWQINLFPCTSSHCQRLKVNSLNQFFISSTFLKQSQYGRDSLLTSNLKNLLILTIKRTKIFKKLKTTLIRFQRKDKLKLYCNQNKRNQKAKNEASSLKFGLFFVLYKLIYIIFSYFL